MDEAYSTAEYLATLRRRRAPLLVTAFVAVLTAVGFAFGLPPVYQSTGTILVEQQEIPLDFVRSTVTSYADQRIQVISQRVISRQNLSELISRHGLVDDPTDIVEMNVAIARMRSSVLMEMIDARVVNERTGNVSSATIAFTVSYQDSDPMRAQAIASELVDLYLEQNVSVRTASAAEASSFLAEEVELLNAELNETEAALSRFKQDNADAMPARRDLYLQYIERAERELTDLDRDLRELRQVRNLLEVEASQIPPMLLTVTDESGGIVQSASARLQELQAEYLRLSSIYSNEHPDLVALRKEIALISGGQAAQSADQLQASLAQAQAELDLAEQRYSDEHPDVARLRRSVARLTDELNAALTSGASGAPEPNNPEYIALQVRLASAQEEVVALTARRSELLGAIASYDEHLLQMPEVEREELALMREYDLARQRYNEARQQQREARLAETLEAESKGERLTILDSPRLPTSPISPNRPAIIFLGIVLALAGGIGIAALIEALDGSVRNSKDLRNTLEAPPLAVIPYVDNSGDARRRLFRNVAFGATAAASIWFVSVFV